MEFRVEKRIIVTKVFIKKINRDEITNIFLSYREKVYIIHTFFV